MRRLLLACSLIALAGPALAQRVIPGDIPSGFYNFGPSTGAAALSLPQNQIFVGNVSNTPTAVAMSGDCTIVAAGAVTCLRTNGVLFGSLATMVAGAAGTHLVSNGTTFVSVAMSGDCTQAAGGAVTCTKANGVAFAAIATSGSATDLTAGSIPQARYASGTIPVGSITQRSASTLVGNPSGIAAVPTEISISTDFVFSGTTLQSANFNINRQTGSYSAAATDCNKTIVMTAALGTFTLGPPAGLPTPCRITLYNENTTRAQEMAVSGLTGSGLRKFLWPRQTITFFKNNSVWHADRIAERWRWDAGTQYVMYVDKVNGSDGRDCLAVLTGSCLTIQHALNQGCNDFDTNGMGPLIQLADAPGNAYAPFQNISDCIGGNLVSIIGNDGGPQNIVINTAGAGGPVVYAKDKGYISITGVTLQGDVAGASGLSCGQHAVIDANVMIFSVFSGGVMVGAQDFCRINQGGTWFLQGNAGTFASAGSYGTIAMPAPRVINITAPITFDRLWLASSGTIIGGATFTGGTPTMTIATCLAQLNGIILKGGSAPPPGPCDQASSAVLGGQVSP